MATKWPDKRRLLGKKYARIDGADKSTGKAKYTYDINRPGQLHAVVLRCPLPRAKIKSLDTSAAEKLPGFKAIHVIAKEGTELYYAGDEVLAIAADTEAHAHDCVRAVKIEYDKLPFVVTEQDALKQELNSVPLIAGSTLNVRKPTTNDSENFDAGKNAAEVRVEGNYGMPCISHQCLESHGVVAEWDKDDKLTVWASTQAVFGNVGAFTTHFARVHKLDMTGKVTVLCHYMGGGFGSKFTVDAYAIAAAEMARKARAPVKLMLDRASEVTCVGNRPSASGKVTIGGKKDGTITFFEHESHGTPGVGNAFRTIGPMPYVYPVEHKVKHTVIRLNTGAQRAMRAPGHPQSCFFTDSAVDDFAAAIGMDPMQVRLKNLPPQLPQALKDDKLAAKVYEREIALAAKLSGWKDKWHPPGKGKLGGAVKHGIGMALHSWGGQASPQPNETTVTISSDGGVLCRSSTQDLGTAQRTVTALVAAEVLGLEVKDITVQLGNSTYGRSTGSGGSTTCPSQAPATLRAATAARDELFRLLARKIGAKAEDLEIQPGRIRDKTNNREFPWKKACALLGTDQAQGKGTWTFGDAKKETGVSSVGAGGVQVAEVLVDTETGVVKVVQIVAVQDCGLIINKLACEAQVAGGVIMGLNYALYEEIIVDRHTGRVVNPDMEFYKLGGINDMPKIIVEMVDMPERGVIGIGEPPTISTHAAIGNAIHNAIGVRVGQTPFSPERVLQALSVKGGK